jgi:hypothetical protein
MRAMKMTDHQKTVAAHAMVWGGLWGAFGLTALITVFDIGRSFGVLVVLLVAVAIAGNQSLVMRRYTDRITDAVKTALETGITASISLTAHLARNDVCVLETDPEGTILSIERPDVIDWEEGVLTGRPIDRIIPGRFLDSGKSGLCTLQGGEGRSSGPTLGSVQTQSGEEKVVRVSIAKVGDHLIGTLTPVRP